MKRWLTPPLLKRGDTVGVVAPSDVVEEKYVLKGIGVLKKWGLKVRLGKHLYDSELNFAAGTPAQRLEDLLSMWLDPKVKIIWAALGGYSATQLWPLIDRRVLNLMRKYPKWLIGYSDVCTLLNIQFGLKVKSLHGPNLSGLAYWDEESKRWLKKLLFKKRKKEDILKSGPISLTGGTGRGRLLLSNLDTLITSFGTKFDPLANIREDVILGLEELRMYKSTIQRQVDMIMSHKNAARIKGIIIGRFTDLLPETGYVKWGKHYFVEEMIRERVAAVNEKIPVVSFSKFGHMGDESLWRGKIGSSKGTQKTFLTLINGAKVSLKINKNKAELKLIG